MDRPVAIVLSIVAAVVGMIAAIAIMWGGIGDAQQDVENVNPYAGITVQAVCTAAGGTWTASTTASNPHQCN